MSKFNKLIIIQFLSTFIFLLIVELFSGYFLSRRIASGSNLKFLDLINLIQVRLGLKPKSVKLELYNKLKKEGQKVYFHTIFDPAFSSEPDNYLFGFPKKSKIIYQDEGEGLIVFDTNSLGFRKSSGEETQNGQYQAFTFGDSYVDGCCVENENTISSRLYKLTGKKILNLGAGGTGPFYSLSLLQELIGSSSFKKEIKTNSTFILSVFSGNDLQNIREDKTGHLYKYLNYDDEFLYFDKYEENNKKLEFYNKKAIKLAKKKDLIREQLPLGRQYGISLSKYDLSDDLQILDNILRKFQSVVEKNNHKFLLLVLENHPGYPKFRQDEMGKTVRDFCSETNANCIFVDLNSLPSDHFGKVGQFRGHLNSRGYDKVAKLLSKYID